MMFISENNKALVASTFFSHIGSNSISYFSLPKLKSKDVYLSLLYLSVWMFV